MNPGIQIKVGTITNTPILIEPVSNGWIVRDFDICTGGIARRDKTWVFVDIKELQKAMPLLLMKPEVVTR